MDTKLKLSPSQSRIINMPINVLIGHYQVIQQKESTLSSTQRNRVENRIKYHLKKGNITQEMLDNTPF